MTIKRAFFFLIIFLAWVSTAACQQPDHSSIASDYIKNGNACYDNKEYSKAISFYTKAFNEDPKNILAALAHYKCAKTFERMGKHSEAVSECSKSIAINPLMNKGLAYFLRGLLYEKTRKYVEAVSDYSKALVVDPDNKEAEVRRQRLQAGIYAKLTEEGAAAFNRGLAAHNGRKDSQSRKELDRAASLFACAMGFDMGDKNAFAMANFTKGLLYQIMTREILGAVKPASSDREAMPQLVSAYYTLAVTNAYYKEASPSLKNENMKNSLKELNAVNDKDMDMVRPRIAGLESRSGNYIKVVDLEAACIVNFDAASQAIAIGDHDGAGRILDENDSMVSDLKRLKSANADGMRYLTKAYAGLNEIFSYPVTDRAWLKANREALESKIGDCLKDLGHAKSALVNKELVNNCSRALKNVSAIRDTFEKVYEKL